MTAFRIADGASHRLDEIFDYTRRKWGDAQAETYIRGLFDKFKAIAAREFPWRAIPAEFGVDGFVCQAPPVGFVVTVGDEVGIVGAEFVFELTDIGI